MNHTVNYAANPAVQATKAARSAGGDAANARGWMVEMVSTVTTAPQTTSEDLGDAQTKLLKLSFTKRVQRAFLQGLSLVAPRAALQVAFHHFTSPRRKHVYRVDALPGGATPFTLPFQRSYLRGYCWGAGERTVYLVHGWESHVGWMAGFVEPLVAAGFRVVAFDAPGHGHSGWQPTHLGDISAALGAVIAHIGKPHALVAHSYGAAATALLLKRSPELTPDALALVAPMTSLQTHLDIFNCIVRLTPHLLEKLTARLEAKLGMAVSSTDLTTNVQAVHARGLLVHDRQDDVIPFGEAVRVAAAWKGAAFHPTAGRGHRAILRDSDVIKNVTDFVAGR